MNNNKNYFRENFTKQSHNNCYYSTIINNIHPRRNSYQMAIHTSLHEHLSFISSTPSSISSIDNCINTNRLFDVIDDHLKKPPCQNDIHYPDNNFLLENATYLLDSPVHALRSAHYKSCGKLDPTKSLSIEKTIVIDKSIDENNESIRSIYKIVFLRSFASVFALASLFSIEVLQTSIYSIEHSFQSLLTLHLSSSITALIFSAHTSHIQITRYNWKISNVLSYDRFSKMLIIFSTLFTSTWIIMQYFYSYYHLLLLTACISGISLSLMIIKTYDHLLQLSTLISNENRKYFQTNFNIFLLIYNSICHLALILGGFFLLIIILFEQWKYQYILIGFQTCFFIPCLQLNNQIDNSEQIFQPIPKIISINLTMYLTETKQVWLNEPLQYIIFIILMILTLISLFLQTNTQWTTSIMNLSRKISLLYYSNNDKLHHRSKRIYYQHYLFALFIGFQEGYLFSSVIKFDVTCLYGLRHTVEMLIVYGLGATISSICIALILKYLTIMTSVSFTTFVHIITIILLYFIEKPIKINNNNNHTLTLKYIFFSFYGIVLGSWSTIAIHSICNSIKYSSSSIFAQTLAFRYLGRIIAYTCTLFLCQTILFYINSISLLFIFSLIFICYCCCNQ